MKRPEKHPRLGRRPLLWATLSSALLSPLGSLTAATGIDAPSTDPLAALGPWLDTLIPADETPGATGMGIDRLLLGNAGGRPAAMRLLESGGRWLQAEAERRGGSSFAALPEASRVEIAQAAASSANGSLPRVFFDNTWRLATFLYYADPATWPALRYDGPPQPAGFLDADQPPS